MERVGGREEKMEGHCSTGQSPQWAVVPTEEVQTGPGAHPASCTMGTGSLPGVKSGRGVTLTHHPFLVPWSRKSILIPLLPLCAVRPVQSLSACTVELYFYSPYGPYGLYRASVLVQHSYTSTPPMGRTACTEPQCLCKGALYLFETDEGTEQRMYGAKKQDPTR